MKFTKFHTIILSLLIGISANAQTWTDVTNLYIKNANFMQGDKYWEGTNFGKINSAYSDAEFYGMTYYKYQEISGLPAGRYRITLKGFYRIGDSSNDYSLYTSGSYSDSQYSTLFCQSSVNYYSAKLPPISSGASYTNYGGDVTTVGGGRLYIPNGMESARYWFDNGEYKTTFMFQVGADGNLTIGLTKDQYLAYDWTCFGDLKLEYYGKIQYGDAKDLIINEVMTNNIDVYLDASLNYGSWFEVYNPTDQFINLGGLYVSSDATNL